jgi:hypothetical protein
MMTGTSLKLLQRKLSEASLSQWATTESEGDVWKVTLASLSGFRSIRVDISGFESEPSIYLETEPSTGVHEWSVRSDTELGEAIDEVIALCLAIAEGAASVETWTICGVSAGTFLRVHGGATTYNRQLDALGPNRFVRVVGRCRLIQSFDAF